MSAVIEFPIPPDVSPEEQNAELSDSKRPARSSSKRKKNVRQRWGPLLWRWIFSEHSTTGDSYFAPYSKLVSITSEIREFFKYRRMLHAVKAKITILNAHVLPAMISARSQIIDLDHSLENLFQNGKSQSSDGAMANAAQTMRDIKSLQREKTKIIDILNFGIYLNMQISIQTLTDEMLCAFYKLARINEPDIDLNSMAAQRMRMTEKIQQNNVKRGQMQQFLTEARTADRDYELLAEEEEREEEEDVAPVDDESIKRFFSQSR